MAALRAARILDLVFGVSLLPLQARVTILCVSCFVEAATRSWGFKLCPAMIWPIGWVPRLRSILSFIECLKEIRKVGLVVSSLPLSL